MHDAEAHGLVVDGEWDFLCDLNLDGGRVIDTDLIFELIELDLVQVGCAITDLIRSLCALQVRDIAAIVRILVDLHLDVRLGKLAER